MAFQEVCRIRADPFAEGQELLEMGISPCPEDRG